MDPIKEKRNVSNKRTKIQLLTLAPTTWSINEIKSFFSVTEYQAKKLRKLFKEKGVLAISPIYKGKSLSEETEQCLKEFYDSNEFSHIMPGKKDYVSIGKNIHRQKKLILCNLKELYVAFKEKKP